MTGDTRAAQTVGERVSTMRATRLFDSRGVEYIRFENGQIVRGDRAFEAFPTRVNGRAMLRFPAVPYVSGRQRRKQAKAARAKAWRERDAREFKARLEDRREARVVKHEQREVA
jgi:hypothetical protein